MELKKVNTKDVADLIAERVSSLLDAGPVTWFVSGGSNIAFECCAIQMLKSHPYITRLTTLLIDERFGVVDHKDSNWWQLKEAGFMIDGPQFIEPFTTNEITLDSAVTRFEAILKDTIDDRSYRFAQLGLGNDGHIAGILPNSPASVQTDALAIGYESKPYTRLTASFLMLRTLNEAVLVALDDSKTYQLERLTQTLTVTEQPAQVVKDIPRISIYTKQEIMY